MSSEPLDSELRFHIDQLTREYIAAGLDPIEARRRARLEFGGLEQIKEDCRDVLGRRWLDDICRDLRYAVRTLLRSPAFLAVAILSLALGIGANTAIFSLIDAVLLRPLPVQQPARLVQISRVTPEGDRRNLSYPLFQFIRDHAQSISGAFVESNARPVIVMDGAEETISAALVSGSYYRLLGVGPAAGRLLEPADDAVPGASPVAVISDAFWQRRFARDPTVVGKAFSIRGSVFTISGITPRDFQGTERGRDPDITFPLSMNKDVTGGANEQWRTAGDFNFLSMMARLKPAATLEGANAELRVLFEGWQRQQSESVPAGKDRERMLRERAGAFSAAAGFNGLRTRYTDSLLLLMGIVGLVLLLACANLSSLLAARAASRQREISIRLAIGAGKGRLVRQFLTESLVLAVLGGAFGLLLARWFGNAMVAMMANGGRLDLPVGPDWRVLTFTGAVSLAACLLAGLAPACHAMRISVNPALKETRTGGTRAFGRTLVVAQLSISMVLLVGAALFIGTLVKLYRLDSGFRAAGVLTFRLRSPQRYSEDRGLALATALLKRLNAVPGVTVASAVKQLPITDGLWDRQIQVEGYTFRRDEDDSTAYNVVAPQYFATMGTPLLLGREFEERDSETASKVAIVNQRFARYFFRGRSPIGLHVTSVGVTTEIVGVVKDAQYQNLRTPVPKTMYIPWRQRPGEQPTGYTYLAHAATGDPMVMVPALERAAREVDPGLRVSTPATFRSIVNQSTVTERIMATLAGFFGLLALLVACLGIFGIMAFQVSRRINELGVRMALGARRADIVSLVMKEVALIVCAGAGIGSVAALSLTRLTTKLLFGVTPTEPMVFVLSAGTLAAATFAAAWLPATRAAKIDPLSALRHE